MRKIMVCDNDSLNVESCCVTLNSYELTTSNSMKDCIEAYLHDDERPELLLSAYQLADGNGAQVSRAMNEIGFIKVIMMTTKELGTAILEPLYADNLLHATIDKPIQSTVLSELVARTLARCPVCDAHYLGNHRELPCSYCQGSGKYTKAGYAFFLHHTCDCMHQKRCDVCHTLCHHLN